MPESLPIYQMTRNFDVLFFSLTVYPDTICAALSHRFHYDSSFSLFPIFVEACPLTVPFVFPLSPLSRPHAFLLVSLATFARFFHAYLRGTYLPGLSGNLMLAPSPRRSPPFRPTVIVRNYLFAFSDLSTHSGRYGHIQYSLSMYSYLHRCHWKIPTRYRFPTFPFHRSFWISLFSYIYVQIYAYIM